MPRSEEELRRRREFQRARLEAQVDHRPMRRRVRLSKGEGSLGHELSVEGIWISLSCATAWLLICQLLPEGSAALAAMEYFRWGGPVLAACVALTLHGIVAKEPHEAIEGSFSLFFVPLFWVREVPAWTQSPHLVLFFAVLLLLVPYVMSGLADPNPATARDERRARLGCLFFVLIVFAVIHYLDTHVASVDVIFQPIFDGLQSD